MPPVKSDVENLTLKASWDRKEEPRGTKGLLWHDQGRGADTVAEYVLCMYEVQGSILRLSI